MQCQPALQALRNTEIHSDARRGRCRCKSAEQHCACRERQRMRCRARRTRPRADGSQYGITIHLSHVLSETVNRIYKLLLRSSGARTAIALPEPCRRPACIGNALHRSRRAGILKGIGMETENDTSESPDMLLHRFVARICTGICPGRKRQIRAENPQRIHHA